MHKVSIYRGGTSKGLFFHKENLPKDRSDWENFLLDVMGSPDVRQIDGLGGADSLTSKVAIIEKSNNKDYDIEYTFAQVSVTQKLVDFKGNCGNISSAVGPFAVNEKLVNVEDGFCKVRILNTNTNKIIISEFEVKNNVALHKGNTEIPGAPGVGAKLNLTFTNPEGAVTGKLLPTGNPVDEIETSFGKLNISIVDAANPLVFMRAKDLGLTGVELSEDYTTEDLKKIEEIRCIAAELSGIEKREFATAKSPAVPKVAIINENINYKTSTNNNFTKDDYDLSVRMMSLRKLHKALAVTGAICTTIASKVEGTLVQDIVKSNGNKLRIGHPAGIMETAYVEENGTKGVTVVRTARRLLDGYCYTKNEF